MIFSNACPLCGNPNISKSIAEWHNECKCCKYEFSNFRSQVSTLSKQIQTNEDIRLSGLKKTRLENFKTINSILTEACLKGASLLEIGSAHGWFLVEADKNFNCVGIEPDRIFKNVPIASGCEIKVGLFPEVLNINEKFDIIVFNDVIEHIPDINQTLRDCHNHLKKGGSLFINLPSSSGILYRIAKKLAVAGFQAFFHRMWQKGMSFPHLHYFNKTNLSLALENNGFSVCKTGKLKTVTYSGLYSRISYVKGSSKILGVIVFGCVIFALPFLSLFPEDIMYILSKKKDIV